MYLAMSENCLFILMFLIHNKFSEHPLSHKDTKLKKKQFFLVIRTQDLLSQQISCITESSINYVDHIITLQYIPSTYLSCNWKYVPFDCLQPIPPPPSPASSKHNSDLFSYEFICFENIIDLQHYISFCYIQYFCTIQNDHHDKSGYHTKLLHNY